MNNNQLKYYAGCDLYDLNELEKAHDKFPEVLQNSIWDFRMKKPGK